MILIINKMSDGRDDAEKFMEDAIFGDNMELYGQIYDFYSTKIEENTQNLRELEGRKDYGEQVNLLYGA